MRSSSNGSLESSGKQKENDDYKNLMFFPKQNQYYYLLNFASKEAIKLVTYYFNGVSIKHNIISDISIHKAFQKVLENFDMNTEEYKQNEEYAWQKIILDINLILIAINVSLMTLFIVMALFPCRASN